VKPAFIAFVLDIETLHLIMIFFQGSQSHFVVAKTGHRQYIESFLVFYFWIFVFASTGYL